MVYTQNVRQHLFAHAFQRGRKIARRLRRGFREHRAQGGGFGFTADARNPQFREFIYQQIDDAIAVLPHLVAREFKRGRVQFVSPVPLCSISVLMNNSCRAPALSAIAFHPFVVGTVT